jgi:hypothetical protein
MVAVTGGPAEAVGREALVGRVGAGVVATTPARGGMGMGAIGVIVARFFSVVDFITAAIAAVPAAAGGGKAFAGGAHGRRQRRWRGQTSGLCLAGPRSHAL